MKHTTMDTMQPPPATMVALRDKWKTCYSVLLFMFLVITIVILNLTLLSNTGPAYTYLPFCFGCGWDGADASVLSIAQEQCVLDSVDLQLEDSFVGFTSDFVGTLTGTILTIVGIAAVSISAPEENAKAIVLVLAFFIVYCIAEIGLYIRIYGSHATAIDGLGSFGIVAPEPNGTLCFEKTPVDKFNNVDIYGLNVAIFSLRITMAVVVGVVFGFSELMERAGRQVTEGGDNPEIESFKKGDSIIPGFTHVDEQEKAGGREGDDEPDTGSDQGDGDSDYSCFFLETENGRATL